MFSPISSFSSEGREAYSIASQLEGTLLISRNYFPYFILVALEAGSPLRALILLLISPLLWLLDTIYLENFSLRVTIFVALVGLKVDDVKRVAKAVLPRFYLENVRESTYKAISCCGGNKYVFTCSPSIMVEHFLKEYLNIGCVTGTELRTFNGYCLGIPYAIVPREPPRDSDIVINVGLGDSVHYHSFMLLCQERYFVSVEEKASTLPRKYYSKPLIFHDGRLVARPTPWDVLAVFLWQPMGVLLAIFRLLIGKTVPYKYGLMAIAATGMRITVRNLPPNFRKHHEGHASYSRCTCESCDPGSYTHGHDTGTLYVCSHRTLVDPVIVSTALQKPVQAVTYSVSRVSELLSPIKTFRLSRDRAEDGKRMQALLMDGDLVVCPEGTTCREPYLLRFSPLFSEIGDVIVPVAVSANGSMFYGTSVRGHKWLDSFFFLMNPTPDYYLQFLEKLSGVHPGKSSFEMANRVQKMIGDALRFQCTNLTRKDKYRILAENDGTEI
ncbi:hypothetical protein GIB67_020179 [Kingdonia uniflora]|uniref:Phospholipid/glycerol acyltransferase domain-containing protein n=1 Tax=Kingdonia uniflora TaxID=39325 RepID=A0A7J7NTT7_9MAGN|nr:hypothetical protein GIB67_020179 [Kingdonia uniflora]